jgi:L-asparaginase
VRPSVDLSDVDLHPRLVRRPAEPFRHRPGFDGSVVYLPVWPGADGRALDRAVDAGTRVIVVGAYGVGNVPGGREGWAGAIARATARGAVVLLVTQCGHGGVRPALYEAGRAALEAGAVAGHDLTVEAALVKSMHLLAQGLTPSELRAALPADLAGELTADTDGGEGSP